MLTRGSLIVRCAAALLIFLAVAARPGPAFAYRPFDGTDAAVAAPGELEVELQPGGIQHEGATQTSDRAVDGPEFRLERRMGGGFRGAW